MDKHLARRRQATVARNEAREYAAELEAAQQPAKRATARIQAAALAAHTGLICVEVLAAAEVQAVQRQGAVLDARARAINDTYAGLVTTELARLALEG